MRERAASTLKSLRNLRDEDASISTRSFTGKTSSNKSESPKRSTKRGALVARPGVWFDDSHPAAEPIDASTEHDFGEWVNNINQVVGDRNYLDDSTAGQFREMANAIHQADGRGQGILDDSTAKDFAKIHDRLAGVNLDDGPVSGGTVFISPIKHEERTASDMFDLAHMHDAIPEFASTSSDEGSLIFQWDPTDFEEGGYVSEPSVITPGMFLKTPKNFSLMETLDDVPASDYEYKPTKGMSLLARIDQAGNLRRKMSTRAPYAYSDDFLVSLTSDMRRFAAKRITIDNDIAITASHDNFNGEFDPNGSIGFELGSPLRNGFESILFNTKLISHPETG
jgi:hypothetical protein